MHVSFDLILFVFLKTSFFDFFVYWNNSTQAVMCKHHYFFKSFFSCPPRTFLPALCRIFLDDCAPDNVLEVTARAITYYLDVSAECTRRIVAVEGAIKALCNRLVVVDLSSRTSKDLGEQCVKVILILLNMTSNQYVLVAVCTVGLYRNLVCFIKIFSTNVQC